MSNDVPELGNESDLDRANAFWEQVQEHLGEHRVDVALYDHQLSEHDADALAVHESDDGTVSFHTEDRSLTLPFYPEAELVVRQLQHGQRREISLHRNGEPFAGWNDLAHGQQHIVPVSIAGVSDRTSFR